MQKIVQMRRHLTYQMTFENLDFTFVEYPLPVADLNLEIVAQVCHRPFLALNTHDDGHHAVFGAVPRPVAMGLERLDQNLNVTGQFGGTGDPRTPAVIQGGHCTGDFD